MDQSNDRDRILLGIYQDLRAEAADITASFADWHVACCQADDMIKEHPHLRQAFAEHDRQAALQTTQIRVPQAPGETSLPSAAGREFKSIVSEGPDKGLGPVR